MNIGRLTTANIERNPSSQERREAIRKQLQYLKKNLFHIEELIKAVASLNNLGKKQQNLLETVKKL